MGWDPALATSPGTLLAPGNSVSRMGTRVPGPLHFGSDTSKSHLGAAGSGLPRISLPAPAFYLPCHAQPQFPHQATASLHITRTDWVGHVKTSGFAWLIILNIRNASLPHESESSGLD